MKFIEKLLAQGILIGTALAIAGCNQQRGGAPGGTNSVYSTNSASANGSPMNETNAWQSAKEKTSNLWESASGSVTGALESAKEAGSSAWQKAEAELGSGISTNFIGYDYSKKNQFLTEARAGLDKLDKETANFSKRVSSAPDTTRADLQQRLQEINGQRATTETKFEKVKSATETNWADAKAEFVKSFYDLKATLKEAEDSMVAKL